MITLKKSYVLELPEQQAKELYELLKNRRVDGKLTIDHDLIFLYDELHKIFGVGIR